MGNAFPLTTQQTFRFAGLYNFCILFVSKGFGPNLGEIDSLFDLDGCISICLWGMAYLAQGESFRQAPWVSLVFCVEKLFYSYKWISFWKAYDGTAMGLLDDDWANIFFVGYGPTDFAFGLFFLKAFLDHRQIKEKGI